MTMRLYFSRVAIIVILAVVVSVFTFAPTSAQAAKRTGTKPVRAGVILVTPDKYKGIIPTGHAAIVQNKEYVIESLSDGVGRHKNNWEKNRNKIYGVTVKKTTAKQDETAYKWCAKKIGKKYNWNYLNVDTRAKFYCSHLVWASYKDNFKINMNTSSFGKAVHPMELVNTDKTRTIYTYVK